MEVITEIIQNIPFPVGASRTVGVHLSSIIRNLAIENGLLKNEDMEELSLIDIRDLSKLDIVSQLRMSIGLAWEQYYIPLLPNVIDHPGEIELHGIYMTPDGKSISSVLIDLKRKYRRVVHEVKATYKSVKTTNGKDWIIQSGPGGIKHEKEIRKNFMWMAQLKSYCVAENTNYAELHVLYLCSDYTFPIRPMLIRYYLTFTDQELENNMRVIRFHRDRYLMLGE